MTGLPSSQVPSTPNLNPNPSEPSTPDPFTHPYWQAAAGNRLLLRRCRSCGQAHHHPREFCPHCWSEDVEWEEASGRARLYTWSVVHRNDLPGFRERTPYVVAVVELAEGPRMATEVVGGAPDALRAGVDLEVDFREGAPVFKVRGGQGRSLD